MTRHTTKHVPAFLALAGTLSCASAPIATPQPDEPVRNIILMIADGTGVGVWTAAAYASEELAISDMPVVGLLDTRSASSKVTDSAAGAAVFALGERVTNRTLGVVGSCPLPSPRDTVAGPFPEGCTARESWFHLAREKGKATGLVTTTEVVDATPAAFVAHSPSRYWRDFIAEQFAEAGLDVLMGGGRARFTADGRADRRDLLAGMCAAADCIDSAAGLAAYRASERPVVGLFTPLDMDALPERPVALPDMVDAALARLSRDPDGFVAMFETEAVDNATHANDPLERVTADILEFDRAVRVALDFTRRTPGTLLVVTSDHETGGFSLVEVGADFELRYTTRGHSAAFVPLFAAGAGAARFGGYRENVEIGRVLFDIVRGW